MGRLLRPALLAACAVVIAVALTLVAAVTLGGSADDTSGDGGVVTGQAASTGLVAGPVDKPGELVAALQNRLRSAPRDHRSWSTLTLAYVEQARVTADPSYYAKAEKALDRATALAPKDSVVLTAAAALLSARHDFTAALDAADRAVAVNPYSAAAHSYRSDALTELGRYRAARKAAVRADNVEPGPSTFARLSYAAELRGDLPEATRLMTLSRDAAGSSAAAYAFASFHLGELARTAGKARIAGRHYSAALDADPDYSPALAGRARLAVARGDLAAAERDYATVVRRLPLPEYVVELGELYLATDRPELAEEQFSVAQASATIAEANGVSSDLEVALYEADHGSPEAALAAAEAEWAARQSIHAADALGWALHAAGRDAEALTYARQATALGTRDARLLYHRGAVEAALGRDADARRHLQAALDIDAGVAPWRERAARQLLADAGGAG